jgi:hypothetical protein
MHRDGQPSFRDSNGVIALLACARRKEAEGDRAGAVQMLITILEANPELLRMPRDLMSK